jgi:hypothetical protein
MREHLLGYLLDALSDDEVRQVERRLKDDPRLQKDLELLHSSLEPLGFDNEEFEVPDGLVERTCGFVAARSAAGSPGSTLLDASAGSVLTVGGWRLADLVVAAGVIAAAGMLFFPAVLHSRWEGDVTACQDNLREIGRALSQYSRNHGGYFPIVPAKGNESVAGIYAVRLVEAGVVDDATSFVCRGRSKSDRSRAVEMPTSRQLLAATGERLREYHETIGGDYGYHLGHVTRNGECPGTQNRSRSRFALLADALDAAFGTSRSSNHGGCGQNVLFEDFHVKYLTSCKTAGYSDDIFRNDDGHIAAGLHEDDSVLARSNVRPMPASPLRQVSRRTDHRALDLAP